MLTIIIAIGIFSFCGYVIVRNILKRFEGKNTCGCSGCISCNSQGDSECSLK